VFVCNSTHKNRCRSEKRWLQNFDPSDGKKSLREYRRTLKNNIKVDAKKQCVKDMIHDRVDYGSYDHTEISGQQKRCISSLAE
jgi:hypothetical protein